MDVRQNIFEEKTQALIAQKFWVSKLIIKFQNTPHLCYRSELLPSMLPTTICSEKLCYVDDNVVTLLAHISR